MSFPKYPKYKDSGVEWLGAVPEHWEVTKLKRLIRNVESGTSVNATDMAAADDEIGVLKTSCVYAGHFDPCENKVVVPDERDRVSCPLREGTLIISRMNTPDLVGAAGHVSVAPPNLYLPDRLWQITFHDCDGRFMYYWTLSHTYRDQIKAACTGTSSSMKNLSQEQFGVFMIGIPNYGAQTAIATFLDAETSKIDSLIAEQRRLIELLKEKRQAVISHAVTKGLNANAPMKPSGIEWLGDVPEHWGVVKLTYLLAESPKNGISPEITAEGTTPTFSIAAVRNAVVDIHSHLKFANLNLADAASYFVRQGDILVLRGSGSKDLVGTAGIVLTVPPENCIYPDILIRLRPNQQIIPWYLVASLNSSAVRPQILNAAQTAAGIWKVSGGSLQETRLPCPPHPEQVQIEAYLRNELAVFDTLTAQAIHAIDLLQERRTALISAAVTGKIDVREFANVEAA